MYQALYRAFRPETFDDLIGQDHIVKILKNQIASDTVGHAYLFCGTRGTGKTTTARLLAKALNCTSDGERPCGECDACRAIAAGTFIDVTELDAASNNSVDDAQGHGLHPLHHGSQQASGNHTVQVHTPGFPPRSGERNKGQVPRHLR